MSPGYRATLISTWKLLGPGDHVDQLLIGHAGEQGHHGDLGVGSVQLLTGAQIRGLGTLEQEEHLGNQQIHSHAVSPFHQKNIRCRASN